ncbi:MAG: cobalamin biosynthesis protein, partial [Pseudomonadota bacterium]
MVSVPLLMLAAWATEVALGWPAWLFARIRHPVVWMGALIELCDRQLNRPKWTHPVRYVSGAVTTLVVVSIVTGLAWGLSVSLPKSWWGILLQIIIASSLIASRSL